MTPSTRAGAHLSIFSRTLGDSRGCRGAGTLRCGPGLRRPRRRRPRIRGEREGVGKAWMGLRRVWRRVSGRGAVRAARLPAYRRPPNPSFARPPCAACFGQPRWGCSTCFTSRTAWPPAAPTCRPGRRGGRGSRVNRGWAAGGGPGSQQPRHPARPLPTLEQAESGGISTRQGPGRATEGQGGECEDGRRRGPRAGWSRPARPRPQER